MTIEDILSKLHKRSVSPALAYDTWLAQGYSLADLTVDLVTIAEQTTAQNEPLTNDYIKRQPR